MINENKIRLYFFLGLLVIVTGIVALIFKPFLSPLLLAGALAVIFRPLYRRLSKTISWPSVSTLITVICILAIVVIPLTLLSGQLFAEATNFYSLLTTGENTNPQITETIQKLNDQINTIAPFIDIDLVTIQEEVMSWLVTNFQFFFTGALKTALNLFIFVFALFYLIRDGELLKKTLIRLSPLDNKDDLQIFTKLRSTINTVIGGALFIALIQGSATSIGFFIFNIPQPIFWGAIGSVIALVPTIGPFLLFIPAVGFKLLAGDTLMAIGLLVWGALIVSSIDNVMRPFVIERGMKVHPFFILISVLGGIMFFGPIGFLLGPIILSLFFVLLGIYELALTDKA